METWRVELTEGGKIWAKLKIHRGIFQEGTLSPLSFVIEMVPLSHILRKCRAGYTLSKSQEKIHLIMYMNDMKLFAKNERELETLIQKIRTYIKDIGMEFGIDKRHMTEGIELSN